MDLFSDRIRRLEPTRNEAAARTWIYIPYDRLHDAVGPLSQTPPQDAILVFMESRGKGMRRPYHKKKLTLVLSAMRHFALEQGERGCRIVYGFSPTSFAEGLLALQQQWNWSELLTSVPAERELRTELRAAKEAGLRLRATRDTAWLSTTEDFESAFPRAASTGPQSGGRTFLMDTFYRAMRRKTGILMESPADGRTAKKAEPIGGRFSFDFANRKPYRGQVPVPERPRFAPDAITREVMALIEERHPEHFGSTAGFDLPVTREDAETLWSFALERLLPYFGPWEDAMTRAEPELFHSTTSPLVNLSLLLPRRLVEDVVKAFDQGRIPLECAEGFVRQILGWREFMRHIHERTDGYRTLAPVPEAVQQENPHAGAEPNFLDARRDLFPVYWGTPSGMTCMDTIVADVLRSGWSHHITRLMVLSNLATLGGVSPRQLTDWFWIAYIDAYDWVVETNVLGMATFADGGLTATKPYVSGAAYIDRMSDYCGSCALNPRKATGEGSCPFPALYWSFLERHEEALRGNQRMSMALAGMRRKSAQERTMLRERAEQALVQLSRGERVR